MLFLQWQAKGPTRVTLISRLYHTAIRMVWYCNDYRALSSFMSVHVMLGGISVFTVVYGDLFDWVGSLGLRSHQDFRAGRLSPVYPHLSEVRLCVFSSAPDFEEAPFWRSVDWVVLIVHIILL